MNIKICPVADRYEIQGTAQVVIYYKGEPKIANKSFLVEWLLINYSHPFYPFTELLRNYSVGCKSTASLPPVYLPVLS